MLIAKITILIAVIKVFFDFLINAYLRGEPKEVFRLEFDKNYAPWYIWVNLILIIMLFLGTTLSVIWFLFLR